MYKNMKIEITNEVQLRAVCDVLESMNYKKGYCVNYDGLDEYPAVVAHTNGIYAYYCHRGSGVDSSLITLTDLLALRDKHIMEQLNAAD